MMDRAAPRARVSIRWPALAFTLGTDFDGEQWTLFKFPLEDLRVLYGIEVDEMNVWRPVIDHVDDHLGQGHLLTVEVDAWYLPDTAGITYRLDHAKTGIVMQMLDRDEPAARATSTTPATSSSRATTSTGSSTSPDGRDPRILLPYVEVVEPRRGSGTTGRRPGPRRRGRR